MDVQTVVIVAIILLAILGIWLLPLRKRWNDDGTDDRARRAALEAGDESE